MPYDVGMKYVPGPMFGQFSGSQGNTTASHNRYGSYTRNRVIPVNPSTPAQTAVRVLLTSFSQQWRALTQGDRDGWIALAILDPTIDTQGQPIVLSGQAYYVGFNMQRDTVGLVRLDIAPALVEVPPSITSAAFTISGGVPTMTYTPVVVNGSATNFQVIKATAPLSAGINFVSASLYKIILVIAGNEPVVPPEDIEGGYAAVFGSAWEAAVGMKIGYRVIGISDSGFRGDNIDFLESIAA